MGFSWFVGLSSIRESPPAWQSGAGGRDVWAGRKTGAAEIAGTCPRAKLVTGGPPPYGSGHEGPRRSCRAPPSAGSTWAVARTAGPRPPAKHASSGTRGHTATSPGPCLQGPPAWSRFRTPSLSLEDLGIGVRSAADAADPQFNDILPAGQARGEWADCTAMVTDVCGPHKVASWHRQKGGAPDAYGR